MSLFFFRLHNLRREEENKRRKKANSGSSTSTGGGMQQRRSISLGRHRYHGTLAAKPSRLFERTPLTPSDSLDEIALQIPRWQNKLRTVVSPAALWYEPLTDITCLYSGNVFLIATRTWVPCQYDNVLRGQCLRTPQSDATEVLAK